MLSNLFALLFSAWISTSEKGALVMNSAFPHIIHAKPRHMVGGVAYR